MKLLIILASAIFLQAALVSTNVLTQKFPNKCLKSIPNFNECEQENFEAVKNWLMKGIPELNFPSLDPLEIESFDFNYTYNEDIYAMARIRHVEGSGLEGLQIAKFDFNPYTLEGEFVFLVPSVKLKLNYDTMINFLGNKWRV